MKKLLLVFVPLCGMTCGADDASVRDFTLECLHPQSEAKADILFTQDLFLLKLYGQTIEEVETALRYSGYVIAPEDSEVYMCAARQMNLPDGMQRCVVVIPPAKVRQFCILYYRWDGKVHRLDGHAVYSYHHVPKAGNLP